MTGVLRKVALGALALATVISAGCDPCFGTTSCGDPRIDAEGSLIWLIDGTPAQGVRVEFHPGGGGPFPLDTLRAESDADGRFRFSADAAPAGTIEGTIVFRPPEPYPEFVFGVGGVRLAPVRVRGDRQFLGSWGVGPVPGPPHISYVGELFYLATGERAQGIEVEFRRTGGVAVEPDTFVVVTDAAGRFPLLMMPAGEGEVVGELEVRPPAPFESFRIPDVRMATMIGRDVIRLIGVWAIE